MKLKRKVMVWKIVSWGLRLSVALFHLFFIVFIFIFHLSVKLKLSRNGSPFVN
jgi:hypothetical protein